MSSTLKSRVAGSAPMSKCMECDNPPTHECIWAEGRGRAWFCDKHWSEWRKEHKNDIDKHREVKDGRVGQKYGENPKNASAQDGKKTGDRTGVGFFIPVPDELAKNFPSLGEDDKSKPHCTFLYIGNVPEHQEDTFLNVSQEVFSEIRNPVRAHLHGPDYFIHPDKDRRVALMKARFSHDLAGIRWKLRDKLIDAGVHVDDSFPLIYKPHVTLAYLDGLTTDYNGDIPHGDWEFDSIEVWGLPKLHKVPFGSATSKKVASRYAGEASGVSIEERFPFIDSRLHPRLREITARMNADEIDTFANVMFNPDGVLDIKLISNELNLKENRIIEVSRQVLLADPVLVASGRKLADRVRKILGKGRTFFDRVAKKHPWQMTLDEFWKTGLKRLVPQRDVSFDRWLKDKGLQGEVASEFEEADFIGGTVFGLSHMTRRERGRLNSLRKKVLRRRELRQKYENEVGVSLNQHELDRSREADAARARSLHKREIRKALRARLSVPQEVLSQYPELYSKSVMRVAKQFNVNVGDSVLYGKYKNKKGIIRGFKTDDKGDVIVVIEPFPKGRKQNKEIKLFKIRQAPQPWGEKQAARPIKIDRQKAKRLVEAIYKDLLKWLKKQPQDKPLGRQVILGKIITIKDTAGVDQRVVVQLESQAGRSAHWVVGGGAGTIKRTGQPVIIIHLNGRNTPDSLAHPVNKDSITDEIYTALLHEMTHIADVFRRRTYKPLSRGERGTDVPADVELDAVQYYNDPGEVRAMMQEIAHQARQTIRRYRDKGLLEKYFGMWGSGGQALHIILKNTDTWQAAEPYLTNRNKKLIMKAVARVLDEEGYYPGNRRGRVAFNYTEFKLGDENGNELGSWVIPESSLPLLISDAPLVENVVKRFASRIAGVRYLMASRVASRYQNKKEVPKADGKGTTTVYEYSESQVKHRNREKAKRIEKLRQKLDDIQEQVKKDLRSKDLKTRLTALAVGLINDTYERVGNPESAKEGHFGVTGWEARHVTIKDGKATFKYVGKSGVSQTKNTSDPDLIRVLKEALKGKSGRDPIFKMGDVTVDSTAVNNYLKPMDITTKDIRGLHANRVMQENLKKIRNQNGTAPDNKKKRQKKFKDEFKKALEETAKAVGHESSTLKSQYLVPGLEDTYLSTGQVKKNLDKQASKKLSSMKQNLVKLFIRRGETWTQLLQQGNIHAHRKMTCVICGNVHGCRCSQKVHDARGFDTTPIQSVCYDCVKAAGLFESLKGSGKIARDKNAIININHATDGDEDNRTLRGFNGLVSSLTLYERAVIQDMNIHSEPILRKNGTYTLRGHQIEPDAVREMMGAGYLQEDGDVVRLSDMFEVKNRLYTATMTPSQKEEEAVEDLLKKMPKKKPPRKDLKNERVDLGDKDTEGHSADDDRDLSLNYKKVASRWLARLSGKVLEDAKDKRPGDYWKTEGGEWGVKLPNGDYTHAKDEEHAAALAAGKREPGGDDEKESPEPELTPEEKAEQESQKEEERFQRNVSKIENLAGKFEDKTLSKKLKGMDRETLESMVKSYTEEMRKLRSGFFEAVPSDEVIAEATKALKTDPSKKRNPEAIGKALAAKNLALNVLANPSIVLGLKVTSEPKEAADLQKRSEQAFNQFSRMSPEIRKKSIEQMVSQLESENDSNKLEELEHIANGLAMAALVAGESVDPLRDNPSEDMRTLAQALHKKGEATRLLGMSSDDFYTPSGRQLVSDAMADMTDEEKYSMMGGTEGPFGAIIKGLQEGAYSEGSAAILKDLIQDIHLDGMTNIHSFLVENAKKGKNPITDPDELSKKVKETYEKIRDDDALSTALNMMAKCVEDAGDDPRKLSKCEEMANKIRVDQVELAKDTAENEIGELPPAEPLTMQIQDVIEEQNSSNLEKRYVQQGKEAKSFTLEPKVFNLLSIRELYQ